MWKYIEVHLYLVLPPILALTALYYPLIGRRDVFKVLWLCFMATLWTTWWDNFIIHNGGWTYPEGSILGRIFLVPLEEHLFFIVQPIFLVLLYTLMSHSRLITFDLPKPRRIRQSTDEKHHTGALSYEPVQTLPRRRLGSLLWVGVFAVGALLVNEAHGIYPTITPEVLRYGRQTFYLGWILIWISPVIGWLTWLGGSMHREGWKAWIIGSSWFWLVDTIAIRGGAWSISPSTSFDFEVVRGLPVEEFIFFGLTSYLVIIATSLISHLHTLLLLSPELPPCPPLNSVQHVALLARVALHPPQVDYNVLSALRNAEVTLKEGSKSFSVAQLAFGREIRIGLVAMYAWCRVTDDLIDNDAAGQQPKEEILDHIRRHLHLAFSADASDRLQADRILNDIPHLTTSDRSAFWLFASILPRLTPVEPFYELCQGYSTDLQFLPGEKSLRDMRQEEIIQHLPIKTNEDLLQYANDVAGSIASAICYLSWSILTEPVDKAYAVRPVDDLHWTKQQANSAFSITPAITLRRETAMQARRMGQALQLVNIARDIAKDAIINRVYVPLDQLSQSSGPESLGSILGSNVPSARNYGFANLPLLDQADTMRQSTVPATADLPPTSRAGARAMIASYFEIGTAIRRNQGLVDERGIKVDKKARLLAAAKAFWFGIA